MTYCCTWSSTEARTLSADSSNSPARARCPTTSCLMWSNWITQRPRGSRYSLPLISPYLEMRTYGKPAATQQQSALGEGSLAPAHSSHRSQREATLFQATSGCTPRSLATTIARFSRAASLSLSLAHSHNNSCRDTVACLAARVAKDAHVLGGHRWATRPGASGQCSTARR